MAKITNKTEQTERQRYVVVCPTNVNSTLTKGKPYVTDRFRDEKEFHSFRITTDEGSEIYCLFNNCAHLEGDNWIIVPEDLVKVQQ